MHVGSPTFKTLLCATFLSSRGANKCPKDMGEIIVLAAASSLPPKSSLLEQQNNQGFNFLRSALVCHFLRDKTRSTLRLLSKLTYLK